MAQRIDLQHLRETGHEDGRDDAQAQAPIFMDGATRVNQARDAADARIEQVYHITDPTEAEIIEYAEAYLDGYEEIVDES